MGCLCDPDEAPFVKRRSFPNLTAMVISEDSVFQSKVKNPKSVNRLQVPSYAATRSNGAPPQWEYTAGVPLKSPYV